MKPIEFPECNAVMGRGQDEYMDLPAARIEGHQGEVLTCWRLSWVERLKVLVKGRMWLRMLTFHQPLQPVRLEVDCPLIRERGTP